MIKDIEESCKLGKSLEIESVQQICFHYNYQVYNFLSEINNNREHVMRIIELPKEGNRTKRDLIN